MKKIFALALAAVMTAGMTTVAFAAAPKVNVVFDPAGNGNFTAVYDENDDGDLSDASDEITSATLNAANSRLPGGTELYILLMNDQGGMLKSEDDVKGYRLDADWSQGKADGKPSFEMIKTKDGYRMAVKVVIPESDNKVVDLIGEISVYANYSGYKQDEAEGYRHVTISTSYGYKQENYDDSNFTWDDAELVTFKGAEDVEVMTFGNDFEFEVDVKGQGKVNLINNTDYNKEFGDMYDYANIDFITFEKSPSFNKIGTAYIYADEDAYIYEVTADGAKAIKGLEWDEDYEAWTFKTRPLGSYAISDVELDEKTVTEDKTDDSSKTDDGVKENPDTGR